MFDETGLGQYARATRAHATLRRFFHVELPSLIAKNEASGRLCVPVVRASCMTPDVIEAVLFCAGRGVRMRPLTTVLAKPALPVLDVPLMAWGLAALQSAGLRTLANVSHLGGTVVDALRDVHAQLPGDGVQVELLDEKPEGYGTAGTLQSLRRRIGERIVTYNGDLLCDVDVRALMATHELHGRPATLVVRRVDLHADLQVDGDRVARFVDRRVRLDVPGYQFVGVAVFERAALERLPDGRPSGLGETLLPALAASGDLAIHVHDGYALDVGTIKRYLRANLDVASGVGPAPPVPPPGRLVEGGYFGQATVVDAAEASGCVVMSGATVRASRLDRCVVWPGETVQNLRAADSVIAVGDVHPA